MREGQSEDGNKFKFNTGEQVDQDGTAFEHGYHNVVLEATLKVRPILTCDLPH